MKPDDGTATPRPLEAEPGEELNRLTHAVIGAAIEVHRLLGPGFLESIYEEALCIELQIKEIPFVRQIGVGLSYKGRRISDARIDLLVDTRVVVELKAVERILPIHAAQVLSYLRATRISVGLLINFNVASLHHGVSRIVLSP
jgi:GxxExxY protein